MLEDLQITSSPDDATAVGSRHRRRRGEARAPRPCGAAPARLRPGHRQARHVALTAFTVVALAAIVYSFTATPIYEGRVQLLIESDDPNVVNFQQVTGDKVNANTLSRQDYYQTQYRLLQSRSVAKKTIDALEVVGARRAAALTSRDGRFSVRAMRRQRHWTGSPAAAGTSPTVEVAGDGETAAQSEAIDEFLDRLAVSPVRNSRLVDVSFQSREAVRWRPASPTPSPRPTST